MRQIVRSLQRVIGQSEPLLSGRLLLGILSMVLVLTGACTASEARTDGSGTGTIAVVATTGMIADVARNIGGERVQVMQMMGPGVDPHLYSATESDVSQLMAADIVFYNGLFLEARMERVLQNLAETKPSIALAESIPANFLLQSDEYEGQADPHVWMDVKLWQIVAEAIRDELIAFDPEHEALYNANAESYLEQLEALEAEIQDLVATVPEEQRILVTAHDAFNYFGQGYDFEVVAPQGISTESEAGVDDIRRTIALVVENEIPAIFVETSIPPDVIEAIVEGARSRGHQIVIGGELFSDAMGEAGTPEGTYIGMIRHNVETITRALRGE